MSHTTGVALLICFALMWCFAPGHAEPIEGEAECRCPCPCPEPSPPEPSGEPVKIPDEVVLDQLMEVYEEVVFSHGDHVDMVYDGCTACHHHAPPGVYQKCGDCHSKALFDKEKLNLINLNAAYHGQCIGCHVDMGGPTGCTECHEIRE